MGSKFGMIFVGGREGGAAGADREGCTEGIIPLVMESFKVTSDPPWHMSDVLQNVFWLVASFPFGGFGWV